MAKVGSRPSNRILQGKGGRNRAITRATKVKKVVSRKRTPLLPRRKRIVIANGAFDATTSKMIAGGGLRTSATDDKREVRGGNNPTRTGTAPLQASSQPQLHGIATLLDKIFYRNRNQHRTQHWWKPFSLLRKYIHRLLEVEIGFAELSRPATAAAFKADDVRKRFERQDGLEERRSEVEMWIKVVLVAKCYAAFSALIADVQFCNLGVVLIGVLAEVGELVGLPEPEVDVESLVARSTRRTSSDRGKIEEVVFDRDQNSEDVGEVIERGSVITKGAPLERPPIATKTAIAMDVDPDRQSPSPDGRGEAGETASKSVAITAEVMPPKQKKSIRTENTDVTRRSLQSQQPLRRTTGPNPSTPPTLKTPIMATKKKKKKKGKKSNVIDDLFGGLV